MEIWHKQNNNIINDKNDYKNNKSISNKFKIKLYNR